jgi:hypothetical protein
MPIKKEVNLRVPSQVRSAELNAIAGSEIRAVVGIDLGDKHSSYCLLDPRGGNLGDGILSTTAEALRLVFVGKGKNAYRYDRSDQLLRQWAVHQCESCARLRRRHRPQHYAQVFEESWSILSTHTTPSAVASGAFASNSPEPAPQKFCRRIGVLRPGC